MRLDMEVQGDDDRAIELVATNLTLYHGLPLACDATLASPLRADGSACPGADVRPGTAIADTR